MVDSVTPEELTKLMAAGGVEVIDVRDRREYTAGHIPGSRSLPLETFADDPEVVLDAATRLVFVCANGEQSTKAALLAMRFAFDIVHVLAGGTRRWASSGRPLHTARARPATRRDASERARSQTSSPA